MEKDRGHGFAGEGVGHFLKLTAVVNHGSEFILAERKRYETIVREAGMTVE